MEPSSKPSLRDFVDAAAPPRVVGDELLDTLAHRAFLFFWKETHPATGLTKDRAVNLAPAGSSDKYTIASIASTGYALAALPVGVERGWVTRREAEARAITTLRFVRDRLPDVHGFFFHFVDWRDGRREWKCELSSIDSGLLVLGALTAGRYFGGAAQKLADAVYARMDWRWMRDGIARGEPVKPPRTLSMGWKPEEGFLKSRWDGYSEASYLLLLALGSPTHALPPEAWEAWMPDPTLKTLEGFPVLGGPGPLFMAQMTPGYFDLRGKVDRRGVDWWANFENAHRANIAYCARRPDLYPRHAGQQAHLWGITACDQPTGYGAQEPRDGGNDGTIAPTAAGAGMLFVPDPARATLISLYRHYRPKIWGRYGFSNALNVPKNWYDRDVIGIDLGMMLLALENRRSGLIWRLLSGHPMSKKALAAAGFRQSGEAMPPQRR